MTLMAALKTFCFCFSPQTGSVVLGCLGIISSVLMIVPPTLILDSHDFYFNEYIRQQKSYGGVDIHDEQIPAIKYFNKVCLASLVAYLVIFIFSSILMISGVASRKSFLLVPWLVVSFLTLLFFLIMSISVMFAIANPKALIVLFPAGIPLGFGIYFWYAVYSAFVLLRKDETAKMVRSANRPEGVNNGSGNGSESNVVSSTAETEETEVCRQAIPISHSTPVFVQYKEEGPDIQRAPSPPPPYEAVAVDIDKEAEALRSGIERSALALKSRLEQQPLVKNDSVDSNGTSDNSSACTTHPLDAIMIAPPEPVASTSGRKFVQAEDQTHLLDSVSFSSSNLSSSKDPIPHVNIEASIIVENSDIAKC